MPKSTSVAERGEAALLEAPTALHSVLAAIAAYDISDEQIFLNAAKMSGDSSRAAFFAALTVLGLKAFDGSILNAGAASRRWRLKTSSLTLQNALVVTIEGSLGVCIQQRAFLGKGGVIAHPLCINCYRQQHPHIRGRETSDLRSLGLTVR